jgi:hypothetical protein
MSDKYFWQVSLESSSGFTLDDDSGPGILDNGQLGFLNVVLDDPRVKIRSVSMSGGRNRELDNLPPSTATIVFDNRDGLFNPNNTSSPYFGSFFPGKPILLFYVPVPSLNPYPMFSGVITEWSFDFVVNGDATATLSAKDLLGLLAGVEIPPTVVPEEPTDQRFRRICLLAGLNDGQIGIFGSYSVMAAGTIEGDALQLVQEVVFQEQGYTQVANNTLYFLSRNQVVNGYNYFFTNTGTTAPGALSYPFTNLAMGYSDDTISNSVSITSPLGTAVYTDAAKVAQFGQVSKSYEVSYSTLAQQFDLAGFLVNSYGAPEFRPNSLDVSIDDLLLLTDPATPGSQPGDLALAFLSAAINYGTPMRVLFAPPGGGNEIDQDVLVSSWSHSSTPSGYNVTIGLEPNPFQGLFVLDVAAFGILDTNKLAF